uniref:Reverse transcriptase domain-containing protein n=1 Tax=Tanacetum cinerariifolium TaxID=118510 RepID=A0A699I185_TANCI|nr:reverse transcriptase domain-containing protein [Tanacetum cinerariifolium]
MSTRSSARNLFSPLDNPELTIRRRSRVDPTLLNEFKMAAEGNGDPPVPDLRTIKELCQPSLNGRGGSNAPIAIQATNFGLKNDMIQQVQNSCQFHGLLGDDANKHLDKFLHVTQSIKVNGVTDDALRLYLFPHSLTHHAIDWFDRLPRNSINTFEQMAKIFLGKYFPPSMVTKLRNEITNFRQCPDESLFEAWERYKISINRCPNHNMLPVTQIDTFYNGLTLRHRNTINAAAGGTFMKRRPEECYDLIENMITHHNDWDTSAQWSGSSSSITSSFDMEIAVLKAEMAEINKKSYDSSLATVGQTQNVYAAGAYQGPMIPTTSSSFPQVVKHETEETKDTVHSTNNGSTKDVQPLVVQTKSLIINSELVVVPIIEPAVAPVSAPKPIQRPSIPSPQEVTRKTGGPRQLSLPNLSPTCMTLELTGRSISRPVEVAEDVFIKVGTFHFLADFIVVDFDADPREPLILERCFLKTRRALIDVFEGELTLRVGKEAITFNLDQTSRYSANYNDMTANRIDVIDMACE